jgi:hypothetical protein
MTNKIDRTALFRAIHSEHLMPTLPLVSAPYKSIPAFIVSNSRPRTPRGNAGPDPIVPQDDEKTRRDARRNVTKSGLDPLRNQEQKQIFCQQTRLFCTVDTATLRNFQRITVPVVSCQIWSFLSRFWAFVSGVTCKEDRDQREESPDVVMVQSQSVSARIRSLAVVESEGQKLRGYTVTRMTIFNSPVNLSRPEFSPLRPGLRRTAQI